MHCSYRLKFFVVRDHLWDGNSLPQLQSSWLCSTRGSRRSKYTEGVARCIAMQRRVKSARRSRTIHYKINDDICGFHLVLHVRLFELSAQNG